MKNDSDKEFLKKRKRYKIRKIKENIKKKGKGKRGKKEKCVSILHKNYTYKDAFEVCKRCTRTAH